MFYRIRSHVLARKQKLRLLLLREQDKSFNIERRILSQKKQNQSAQIRKSVHTEVMIHYIVNRSIGGVFLTVDVSHAYWNMDQVGWVSQLPNHLEILTRHEVLYPGQSSFKRRKQHHHHPKHKCKSWDRVVSRHTFQFPARPIHCSVVDEDIHTGESHSNNCWNPGPHSTSLIKKVDFITEWILGFS